MYTEWPGTSRPTDPRLRSNARFQSTPPHVAEIARRVKTEIDPMTEEMSGESMTVSCRPV